MDGGITYTVRMTEHKYFSDPKNRAVEKLVCFIYITCFCSIRNYPIPAMRSTPLVCCLASVALAQTSVERSGVDSPILDGARSFAILEQIGESPFDDDPMGKHLSKFAQFFGVPSFHYLVWLVNSGNMDVVFKVFGSNLELVEAHFEVLAEKHLWDRIKSLKVDFADISEEDLKKALVGALILDAMKDAYRSRRERAEQVVTEVVARLSGKSSFDGEQLMQKITSLNESAVDSDDDDESESSDDE